MLRANILIILQHQNVIARLAIRVVKRGVGERDLKIAKNFQRSIVRHNALKEDASDPNLENAVTW